MGSAIVHPYCIHMLRAEPISFFPHIFLPTKSAYDLAILLITRVSLVYL